MWPPPAVLAAAGGGVALAGVVAFWHFIRDAFDDQKARVGDAKHSKW